MTLLINFDRIVNDVRTRKCASSQETFYQGECHQIGVAGNPCPRNQQLYDKPDNNGYCFCQRGLSNFVYLNGQCYQQNEQVSLVEIDFELDLTQLFVFVFRDLVAMVSGL